LVKIENLARCIKGLVKNVPIIDVMILTDDFLLVMCHHQLEKLYDMDDTAATKMIVLMHL
jgi:hypothetical protein